MTSVLSPVYFFASAVVPVKIILPSLIATASALGWFLLTVYTCAFVRTRSAVVSGEEDPHPIARKAIEITDASNKNFLICSFVGIKIGNLRYSLIAFRRSP